MTKPSPTVCVSQGFLYGDGPARNATVAEQSLADVITRLQSALRYALDTEGGIDPDDYEYIRETLIQERRRETAAMPKELAK